MYAQILAEESLVSAARDVLVQQATLAVTLSADPAIEGWVILKGAERRRKCMLLTVGVSATSVDALHVS